MVKAIRYNNEDYNKNFIDVDLWEPNPEDEIFKTCKGVLVLPVSQFFGISETTNLDYFILSTKRCYNGKDMRVHLPKYMNYFEKFYDQDKELLLALFKIKYLIDFSDDYSEEMFMYDVERYILSQSLQNKAHVMNEQNYKLDLDSKKYKNDKNPSLTYKDKHAKILMWMSLLMNMIIPVVTHFIYVKKIEDTNGFLLKVFDIIIQMSDVDIYNKLYETSISNVYKNAKSHSILWEMQD